MTLSRCLQCTGGAGRVFSRQFKSNGPYSRSLVCEMDSKGGMSVMSSVKYDAKIELHTELKC